MAAAATAAGGRAEAQAMVCPRVWSLPACNGIRVVILHDGKLMGKQVG